MGGPALVSDRNASLIDLRLLPERYRQMVTALVETQRAMGWSAAASGAGELFVVRGVAVDTVAYLLIEESGRLLFFFRRPKRDEVLFDARVSFRMEPLLPDAAPPPAGTAELTFVEPPFFGRGIPEERRQMLARKLGTKPEDTIFVNLGLFYMAAFAPEQLPFARAAFLHHAATEAAMAYPLPAPPGIIAYNPDPFLLLLDAVTRWARSGFEKGRVRPWVRRAASPQPALQVLDALVSSWEQARAAAAQRPQPDPLRALIPDFGIHDFAAQVLLRLRPNGDLAVKGGDDSFRLQVRLAEQPGGLRITAGPPDFLLDGELYHRLLEELRKPPVIARLRRQFPEPAQLPADFDGFLESAEAVVFRARKMGSRDTEVFVLRGVPGRIAISMEVEVRRQGEELFVDADAGSAAIVFASMTGVKPPPPRLDFPEFLFALLRQLHHWEKALQ